MSEEELPEGWAEASTADLFSFVTSGSRGWAKYYSDHGPLFLRVGNLDHNSVSLDLADRQCVSPPGGAEGTRTRVAPGDVLISITADVGMVAVVGAGIGAAYVNQHLALARPRSSVFPQYLAWYLAAKEGGQAQFWSMDRGAIKAGLSLDDIRSVDVPLPPFVEQRRIVEKVEALLAQVNAARARLAKVPTILKRFRQSILSAACSGRLTEDWRSRTDSRETATDLLDAASARRRAESMKPRSTLDPAALKKLRQRMPTEIAEGRVDFDLPESWAATDVGFVAHVTKLAGFEYTKYLHPAEKGEIPLVRAQNVQMGRFVASNVQYIDKGTADFLERSQLHGREVLMAFIGAGTGNVCLAPSGRWHLAPNVAKLDPDTTLIVRRFLVLYLQSPHGRAGTDSYIKATAQDSLSMETIRLIPISLPLLEEQHEIVRRVDALFKLADTIEAAVAAATARADKITQAILAKAFRGELVPTEAELARQEGRDYEPASALLARIHAAHASAIVPKLRARSAGKVRPTSRRDRILRSR